MYWLTSCIAAIRPASPPQVDEHDMLGPFLGVLEEFVGQCPILLFRHLRLRCPRDGPQPQSRPRRGP